MNRITYMEIAGKSYPLSFSLAASKAVSAKYGDISKLGEIMSFQRLGEKEIETLTDIIAITMKQGAAYKNIFEKDLPPHENADIREGRHYALSREEIEIALGFGDIGEIANKIRECISGSSETELEVETASKNEKAPKED